MEGRARDFMAKKFQRLAQLRERMRLRGSGKAFPLEWLAWVFIVACVAAGATLVGVFSHKIAQNKKTGTKDSKKISNGIWVSVGSAAIVISGFLIWDIVKYTRARKV